MIPNGILNVAIPLDFGQRLSQVHLRKHCAIARLVNAKEDYCCITCYSQGSLRKRPSAAVFTNDETAGNQSFGDKRNCVT